MTDAETPKRGRGRPKKNADAAAAAPKADAKAEWTEAAKESDKVPLETANGTEMLPVKLTEAELHAKGREAGALNAEIASLEAKKKAAVTHFKSKINMAIEARDRAIECLSRGAEDRLVSTIEQQIFATKTVRVIRTDTKEVIRERAMYAQELQRKLPLPAQPAAPAPLPVAPPAPKAEPIDPAFDEMEGDLEGFDDGEE